MASTYFRPTTAGTRHRTRLNRPAKSTVKYPKKLRRINKNTSGRNNSGKITIRHRGGRAKRYLRLIDFKRNLLDIPARVVSIEYDPNRSAYIALLFYKNGDKRYILAPDGLKVNDEVVASKTAVEIEPGNCLPLSHIPVGTPIHNLEITPGKGGQIIRSAGTAAYIQDKDENNVSVRLPSGETRRFSAHAMATIGQLSNLDHKNRKLGKAGLKRKMGWRPSVRGVAMHPAAHPHGGGEGRSGIGMPSPKSPWGKPTLGKKTRKVNKYSNKYIIKDRRIKK